MYLTINEFLLMFMWHLVLQKQRRKCFVKKALCVVMKTEILKLHEEGTRTFILGYSDQSPSSAKLEDVASDDIVTE